MSNVTKNIVTILGVLTIAFAGYYFYMQKAAVDISATDDFALQQMLASTEIFIVRSQELDQMSFDLSVFEDPRFRTLRTFATPVEEQPVGRTNPFAPVGGDNFINSDTE
jgi:hypothetical protein